MKANIFLLIIAAALTALIGYSVYSYSIDTRKMLSTVIFSFTFLIYTGMLLGFKIGYEKAQALKNTVSVLFLLYSIVISLVFIRVEYTIPLYLLINGLPLLIYGAIINFFTKNKI